MKKFRKIIAAGLAAVTAVSVMGISAFAKEEIQLDDGVVLTIYDKEESAQLTDRACEAFSVKSIFL